MGELDYPMLIVTTSVGDERAGCLVGFATQCSIDPERFLVCISQSNRTFEVACASEALIVHFPTEQMHELVALFGSQTGDELDKFERCPWRPGPRGLPVLDDCPRWFAGEVCGRLALGDHHGFLLQPFDARRECGGSGYPFQRAKRLAPGHEA
jgi:flavin reductase (DIM6/NTAB) family NADH-FMN oxidoreductase RutF